MIPCELCGKTFKIPKALSLHRHKCSGRTTSASKLRELIAVNEARHKNELRNQAERHFDDVQDFSMHQEDLPAVALLDAPLELAPGTRRQRRLPKHFTDHVPSTSSSAVLPTASLPHFLDYALTQTAEPEAGPRNVNIHPDLSFVSPKTDYGLYRVYPSKPRDDPDECLVLEDLCDSPELAVPEKEESRPSLPQLITNKYFPFQNAAAFLFARWQNNGVSNKSDEQMNNLAHEISTNPDVKMEDLRGYNAKRERARLQVLADGSKHTSASPGTCDGWKGGSIMLKLPAEDKTRRPQGEARAPELEVNGIQHRPFLETIYGALDDPNSPPFHYTPYTEHWQPTPNGTPERVYSELYSSDDWLEVHDEVRKKPKQDELENFALPIILYSDSTHLANFGTASLWPLYLYLGGISKYMRGKTTEAVCHHIAYIPLLPGNIQDVYHKHYGRTASSELLTHLKRELMQAVLRLVLLQDDVLDTYENGFIFDCNDKVTRRLFPRFMIYSADYPERTLIATIRNLGRYPCPSCLTPLSEVHLLGTVADKRSRKEKRTDDSIKHGKILKARKLIFDDGFAVESMKIKDILNFGGLLPINNAFSALAPLGFNYHDLFIPDLMHEFELGVWKAIFAHLMRILVAAGGDAAPVLNSRYRLVPSFGKDTIRRFPKYTASMQKLAARDFEDILQRDHPKYHSAIPVFEGLLPRTDNETVLTLLFTLATWHALAKLRIHTETTVGLLEEETKCLGRIVHRFKRTTCEGYVTHELPKEIAARGRREAAKIAKGKQRIGTTKNEEAKQKKLNINTPKFHALGYYAPAIRRKGTTDSFSTQISKKESIHLPSWIDENKDDPALTNFVDDLRSHILARFLSRNEDVPFTPDEIDGLHIKMDRLYRLKVLRVNYTTYDLRRVSDTINPNTHPDVMLLSGGSGTDHPYCYARVIGLFHADIAYTGPGSASRDFKRMNIIWVRHLQIDPTYSFGFTAKRLPRLQFLHSDSAAFEFLDPELILRGAHLIPAFAFDKTKDFLSKSLARPLRNNSDNDDGDDDEDYQYYYVNIFVDRDMFMRYRGGGIGHKITWSLNSFLLQQSDTNTGLEDDELFETAENGEADCEQSTDKEGQMEGSDNSDSDSDGYAAL
ncbi:hypothetical protein A7U60_g2627 [Sanghuangporus baumii]|uniref:Uncharacterized protein n=1 Tax=Sanghuangporus baumii TaxID=108892 RepID=A0A9Q5NAS2_SANBA|nr:hypothetical protein A7U60_g2627 [Sanghuangporus baumii]